MIRGEQRAILRSIHTLFEVGTLGGLTDGQLLDQFSNRNDKASESAFEVLVERHGPMVLRVCRSILSDSHAAQDAFQATFLVLVQKSGSLQVRDSLGPWLHQVAFRVASCARSAAARRRKHERKAAELTPHLVAEKPSQDLAPVLHEEVNALPERYRAAVVLCCLEGLTHSQAASQLGCPVGTLQSRLARGRQRLHDRLTRRGLAPSVALLGTGASAQATNAAFSKALLHSTVRAAMQLDAGKAGVEGAITAGVAMLRNEVARSMFMSKLKSVSLAFVTLAALSAGAYTFQARSIAGPETQTQTNAVEAEPSELLGHEDQQAPGPKLTPTHLDFGPLRVDSFAEANAHFFIEDDHEEEELTAKVLPPPFLKVRKLRIRERTHREKKGKFIELGFAIDTSRVGNYSGQVGIKYEDRRIELPVSARVLPKQAYSTKVLVITPSFGDTSSDSSYYRPWFDLVEEANLDVSYLDPTDNPLSTRAREVNPRGMPVLPESVKQNDVILIVDGGPVFSDNEDAKILQDYVLGGGRLIVGASRFMGGSVSNANAILNPFGLEMTQLDITRGRSGGDKGWKPFTIDGKSIQLDPLTHGVEAVVFSRATPVRVTEGSRGKILIYDSENPARGFAAVSRDGGEVIALGPSLLFHWMGEKENGADNAQFLRNLLTRPRSR